MPWSGPSSGLACQGIADSRAIGVRAGISAENLVGYGRAQVGNQAVAVTVYHPVTAMMTGRAVLRTHFLRRSVPSRSLAAEHCKEGMLQRIAQIEL